MRAFRTILIIVQLLQAIAYTDEALSDQVTNLPGTENLEITFNQFSGYLPIDGTTGEKTKNMHYWFVESMNDPANDPIAFWTNGGPGCSGLLGFMTEQGPLKANADLSLSLNEFAWNKVANMVFIESPVGVGFSYSVDEDDYTNGDQQTAIDNYNLIQAFLTRFPEYQKNDLYITSESYGGHYMPTLAKQIVDSNAIEGNSPINFKGFAVGNPYTDWYSGTPASIDTYWGHQLVPKPTYDAYAADCVDAKVQRPLDCTKLALQLMNSIGDLNPYALDYPICTADSVASKGRAQRLWFLNHLLGDSISAEERKKLGVPLTGDYEPCSEDYMEAYLNQDSVKAALHVQSDIKWRSCSFSLRYNYKDSLTSTAPIYNYLIDGGFGLNILVYSGDDDSVCGTIGTQEWIWDLGYEVSGRAWQTYSYNEQTAGYFTTWKDTKLGFLTIHGAGHEVPAYKPDVALDMFSRYLKGEYTNA